MPWKPLVVTPISIFTFKLLPVSVLLNCYFTKEWILQTQNLTKPSLNEILVRCKKVKFWDPFGTDYVKLGKNYRISDDKVWIFIYPYQSLIIILWRFGQKVGLIRHSQEPLQGCHILWFNGQAEWIIVQPFGVHFCRRSVAPVTCVAVAVVVADVTVVVVDDADTYVTVTCCCCCCCCCKSVFTYPLFYKAEERQVFFRELYDANILDFTNWNCKTLS